MKKTIIICILILVGIAFSVSALNDKIISLSLVNQDPMPALAGQLVELRIGIENLGADPAANLVLELVPEYPFGSVQGESYVQKIGTINAGQKGTNMKIIAFKALVAREATAGQYALTIKSYTEGNANASIQKTFNVEVESQESAEVIYIDQVELIPGKITPLKFTVNNVGSSPLRDLTFQWENADDIVLPVGSDNTKYIKYIDVGGSAELDFNVIASATATPNLYKLDLTLDYYDSTTATSKQIKTKAGVYVGGATDFDAAFSGLSSGQASFTISNIGSVAASSVTVKIPEQPGWRVTGTNSVIIGNLNEGDYTIASFNLQQTGNVANQSIRTRTQNNTLAQRPSTQDLTVEVDIIYTDSRGNRNTVMKQVPVDAASFRAAAAASTTGTTTGGFARRRTTSTWQKIWNIARWLVPLIVVLVLAVLGYRKHKKERMKNPDYTYGRLLKDSFKMFKRKKR